METVNASAAGCTEKISVKLDRFGENVSRKKSENDTKYALFRSLSLRDLNFEMTRKSSGSSISSADYKATVDIENFGFKLQYQEEGKVQELKISDVDLSFTIYDGNLFMDLSDKDFENALISTFEVITGEDKLDEDLTKVLKQMLCGKFYIPNFVEEFDIASELDTSDMSLHHVLGVVEKIAIVLSVKNEAMFDKLVLADYPNSKAAGISFAFDGLTDEEKEEMKPNKEECEAKMALYFNKDGLFENFGLVLNLSSETYDKSGTFEAIEIKNFEISDEVNYGKVRVKEPNKDDYSVFVENSSISSLL